MKRFYNDDDEDDKIFENGIPYKDRDDYDDDDDMEIGEAIAYIDGREVANVMNYEIAQEELKHHIMEQAINIAKDSWLWRFKSPNKKMADIKVIFESLKSMIEEHSSIEEPQENIQKEE